MLYFVTVKRKETMCGSSGGSAILALLTPKFSFAFWEKDVTLEDESIYNYLQVKDDEEQTILSTNVLFGVQSIKTKNQELTGMYYDYALAAPVMAGVNTKRTIM